MLMDGAGWRVNGTQEQVDVLAAVDLDEGHKVGHVPACLFLGVVAHKIGEDG